MRRSGPRCGSYMVPNKLAVLHWSPETIFPTLLPLLDRWDFALVYFRTTPPVDQIVPVWIGANNRLDSALVNTHFSPGCYWLFTRVLTITNSNPLKSKCVRQQNQPSQHSTIVHAMEQQTPSPPRCLPLVQTAVGFSSQDTRVWRTEQKINSAAGVVSPHRNDVWLARQLPSLSTSQ